ncbi:gene transfer agent family protein [Salinarimonas sp.]|uniref:gene transfer agent family protein n=1 Tax=Salinarimonas sp. TaxID=2766526 RepID=UPI00391B96F7
MTHPHGPARRGDVSLVIDGTTYRLRLTLGALAELEAALGAGDLGALAERLAAGRLSSRDLVAILGCALRGGGHAIDDAHIAALPMPDGIAPVAEAVAAALAIAFGAGEEASASAPPPMARTA